MAWAYTHVSDIQVQEGDTVAQGALLARVHFLPGAGEHVHLDRLYRPDGARWQEWQRLLHLNPAAYFAFANREQPHIDETFRYLTHGTNEEFGRDHDNVPVLSGDVDVVVGMRDRGAYARRAGQDTSQFYFGDRAGVTRKEFEIRRADGTLALPRRTVFDANHLVLHSAATPAGRQAGTTLYRHFATLRPGEAWSREKVSYYVVTVAADGGHPAGIGSGLAPRPWATAAIDAEQPRFPDGEYVLLVRAVDTMGNATEQTDRVRIRNGT